MNLRRNRCNRIKRMKLQKITSAWTLMSMLSVALFATSCSSEDSLTDSETPSHIVSFTAKVPGAGQPTTRAHWDYSDTYTKGEPLKFLWDAADDTVAYVIHFNGKDWEKEQLGTVDWSLTNYEQLVGNLSGHNNNGEVTVQFTPNKFGTATESWSTDHSACVIYPKKTLTGTINLNFG